MHSIKITAFSCFLLCSFTSYSSAPARLPLDPDELEIPEIHLVPKKDAQYELELATKYLRDCAKKSPQKDLVKKIHQAYCARLKHWADWKKAQQYIENCGQQEIAQGLRDEVQTYATLCEQQVQQYFDLNNQAKGNPDQLWEVLCFAQRQRNIFRSQAFLLRAEKEEWLQREKNMQAQNQQQAAQIQQKDSQIHQQAAQINQLRSALEQQEPGGQQIEGIPHQLSFVPGGIK